MSRSGMRIAMVETGDDPGHAPSRAAYEAAGFERWPVARYFRKLR
jgi:RimJ/RimL family protein N-acetyltransferase